MKLYTEEQFKNAIHEAFMEAYSINDLKEIYNNYAPIELPTGEELEKLAFESSPYNEGVTISYMEGFLQCAKYIRDKSEFPILKGGNK